LSHRNSPSLNFLKISLIFTLCFGSIISIHGNESPRSHLMPIPKKLQVKEGKLKLTSDFNIHIKGKGSTRLYKYATRALNRIKNRTGIFFQQNFVSPDQNFQEAELIIKTDTKAELSRKMNENYHLNVNDNQIVLKAETDIGAMRGLETLLQLLSNDKEGYYFPGITIKDSPRFKWRGLLIDVSRHFEPVHVIKRNLDAMAALKLNVLHWHLSDDQGFRVESKVYPKLHKKASDGKYYTQSQIKEIIQYANNRGIRVIPEFDLPGHATSWIVAYPKLASSKEPRDSLIRSWGIMEPVVDPTQEYTYTFLDNFFKEMANLFNAKYFHIGGDEVENHAWESNPEIQNFMAQNDIKNYTELHNHFISRLLKILEKYDKKMIGWQEILNEDMPKNIVLQVWKDKKTQVKAIKNGYKTILSNGFYIDLMKNASKHYKVDPIPDTSLTNNEKNNILGGEATMWGEFVTEENIDSRIWPRTAAIAERLWSPSHVNDIENMYKRLEYVSFRLEEHGLTHIKNYRMMLRRLTNNQDISPLKTLVDVLEPLRNYKRNASKENGFFQNDPYTRVMDVARADQTTVRKFNNLVDEFLKNDNYNNNYHQIKKYLKQWQKNHKDLKPIMNNSPIIQEIEPASERLAGISQTGLCALEKLNNKNDFILSKFFNSIFGKSIDLDSQKVKNKIKQAKKPVAQTKIRVAKSIEKLIEEAKK